MLSSELVNWILDQSGFLGAFCGFLKVLKKNIIEKSLGHKDTRGTVWEILKVSTRSGQ